jgi:soluble lytic murein transglycosylase-like protein
MGNRGLFLGSAVLALACALPAHADDWIYLQRQNGVRVFTDVKPVEGSFTLIPKHGRQTASASCLGLTEESMQKRHSLYKTAIRKHAKVHNLPPELVSAVMRVESCYDRRAVSRSGARGLMQLMPATAMQLGVNDSFDPDQNIEAGVRYLAQMLARFGNELDLGLAAYNAGPEAVTAYQGVPPYPETRSYVSRIRKLYKAPGQART